MNSVRAHAGGTESTLNWFRDSDIRITPAQHAKLNEFVEPVAQCAARESMHSADCNCSARASGFAGNYVSAVAVGVDDDWSQSGNELLEAAELCTVGACSDDQRCDRNI